MSLRVKALISSILALVGLVAVSYVALQMILPSSFAELEEQETRKDVARALDALAVNLAQLESATGDWARWDDTYDFIENANTNYIKANLTDAAFTNLNLNLMVFVHASGRIVFSKGYDLQNHKEMPAPPSLQTYLTSGNYLISHPDITSVKTGIVSLPEGPLLVTSLPILTSQDRGPMRGVLIFGRFLDATEIARVARVTHLTLALRRLDDPQMPADYQTARAALSEQTPVIVRPLSEQTIIGYALVKDIYGKPALILSTETAREIYHQGQVSTAYLTWALVVIGAAFAVIAFIVVERLFLTRITGLSQDVQQIGARDDPARRVSAHGGDEISGLAREINRMLDAIRQSQHTRRASEERFRALIENSSDLILVLNRDGAISYASPSLHRILGYQADETLTRSVLEFIHPDDHAIVVDAIEHRLANSGSSDYHMQVRVRQKNGSLRVMQAIGSNLLDNPAVAGIVINCRDVTERRRAEEALRDSEEKYRALVENINEVIYTLDLAGRFTYVSPVITRFSAYTPDDLMGKDFVEFIHSDDLPGLLESFDRTMRGEIAPFEYRIFDKNGEVRHIRTSSRLIVKEGAVVGLTGVMTDFTERRRTEIALQESNARFHALVEGIPDLVYLKDAQGHNLYVNKAYEDFTGLARAGVIGKRDDEILPPELAEKCLASDAAVLQTTGLVRLEEPGTDRNGMPIFFETIKNPIFDAAGRVVGLVGISRDITERRQYSERLEQMVEARTRELRDAQEQLVRQERLAVLGQLAGGIAHELRSPLSAIKNAAYYFKMVVENPSPDAREMIEILDQQVDVSARIIGSLLDFARPKTPNLQSAQLVRVIEAAICQCNIPQNIAVVWQADESLPSIKVDAEQMQLVFSNLITNAAQAMPQGGQLTIALQPAGNKMQVAFSDTGVGIPTEALDKVFQPLYTTKAKGIGLGLALTRIIVEAHEGTIAVTSEVGKGTTFTICLPMT